MREDQNESRLSSSRGSDRRRKSMYDVLYMAYRDGAEHRSVVGSHLDRDAACELARSEARKRNAGRMFLAGSEPGPVGDVVLIVESETTAA
jgi:hypothetical protein